MIELVSILASAAVAIAAILGLVYAHYKEMAEVRERLARVEEQVRPLAGLPERVARLEEKMTPLGEVPQRLTRLEVFWDLAEKNLPDFFSSRGSNPYPADRKDELLIRLKTGLITPAEATELEDLLKQDLENAKRDRNVAIGIALLLALALLSSKKTEA